MMALGNYRFSVETAAYQQLSRDMSFLWPTQQRFGQRPIAQYVGLGPLKRTLNGVIYPEYKGGINQIDAMIDEAQQGRPLLLTGSNGFALGFWCITSLSEKATVFHRNGLPRKLTFSMSLLFYGMNYPPKAG